MEKSRFARDTILAGVQIGALILLYFIIVSLVTIAAGGEIDANISTTPGKTDIIWAWNSSAFNGTPDVWIDSTLQEEGYPLNTWYQTGLAPNQKHSLLISYLENNTTLYDYQEEYTLPQIYEGFEDYLFFYFLALLLAIIGIAVPFVFIPGIVINIYAGVLAISSTTESLVLYAIWLTVPVMIMVFAWRVVK